MRRIGILTSGGDSPGMNAAIRAVTRCAIAQGFSVMGIHRGYAGLLENDMEELTLRSVGGIVQRGGTILGTARSPQFATEEAQRRAVEILKNASIDGLVVIGGDGSMRGAMALEDLGIPTVTIPGTIDNDMNGTEYTLGFDTTLNTIIDAVSKIRDTIASHARVAVIEVMGRHAGHLALNAGIACGAEIVLLPERPMPLEMVCDKLRETYDSGKSYSIVLVAEGAYTGFEVRDFIKANSSFDPSVTVLGYIQRGGSPSARDNVIAAQMGEEAVNAFLQGCTGSVIGLIGGQIMATPYEEAVALGHPFEERKYELLNILSR